jgi:hypothetical protein
MLLGTVGELESGLPHYQPGPHALLITNQCIGCHMQTTPFTSETLPAVTGHSFKVKSYNFCLSCHPNNPQAFARDVMGAVTNRIQQLQSDLDYWAANLAPGSLYAKYGNRAWEYTAPGSLSSGGPGPSAAEQQLLPENIRKARFNLYLVLNDGSFGVHNAFYAIDLLDAAEDWIYDEFGP